MTASERTRKRLAEELDARDISQRDLADALSRRGPDLWTQSRVGKVLTGRVELRVDDADAIAQVVGLTLTEAVRDRGLEFCAEMTPSELRVLECLRRRPDFFQGVMLLLGVIHTSVAQPLTPPPTQRKRGRPLNSETSRKRA